MKTCKKLHFKVAGNSMKKGKSCRPVPIVLVKCWIAAHWIMECQKNAETPRCTCTMKSSSPTLSENSTLTTTPSLSLLSPPTLPISWQFLRTIIYPPQILWIVNIREIVSLNSSNTYFKHPPPPPPTHTHTHLSLLIIPPLYYQRLPSTPPPPPPPPLRLSTVPDYAPHMRARI